LTGESRMILNGIKEWRGSFIMQNKIPQSKTPWKFYVLYLALPRGWKPMENFHIEGPGWKVTFRETGPQVPFVRMRGDETIQCKIDQHPGPCVELIVDTNEMDGAKAVNAGRIKADILAGLLVNRLSAAIINDKFWAGLMGTRNDGSNFLAMGENLMSWEGAPLDELKEKAAEITIFDPSKIGSIRSAIPLAYRWWLKGLLEKDHNDRFISIWLSGVALYTSWCELWNKSYLDFCKKQEDIRDIERNKIRFYIKDKLKLDGNEGKAFLQVLSDSYDLRIKVFHQSEIDIITDDNIKWLVKAVGSMLWFEMGFPMGGSPAVLIESYLDIKKQIR